MTNNFAVTKVTLFSILAQALDFDFHGFDLHAKKMTDLNKGGLEHFPPKFAHFCTCHNFSPLSSVYIIFITACCLLYVL